MEICIHIYIFIRRFTLIKFIYSHMWVGIYAIYACVYIYV